MAKKSKDIQSTTTSIKPVTTRAQFDLALYSQEDIQSHIYTIRGQHVMLDSDIARLYGMETKRINEQVKRNPIKFPERYVFQLTAEEVQSLKLQYATSDPSSRSQYATMNNSEYAEVIEHQNTTAESLRSQNATLNETSHSIGSQNATLNKSGRGKHAKYLPYAFTEPKEQREQYQARV